MEEVTTWWEIAKSAGPVSSFVMGVACVALWIRHCRDVDYARENDRKTLEVLHKLSSALESGNASATAASAEIRAEVGRAAALIKEHIDVRFGQK